MMNGELRSMNNIRVLRNALLGGRVSHAYLFTGSEGLGKTAAAMDFSQALLCEAPVDGGPCGWCRSCRQVMHGNHPDYHWVGPSGASIKIQQMREVRRTVGFRPYQGGRRVVIIEQADKMTKEAANSLLKTLEEPPPETHFILLTDRVQNLPPTIVSRCQCITFNNREGAGYGRSTDGFIAAVSGAEDLSQLSGPSRGAGAPPAIGSSEKDWEEACRIAAVLGREGCLEALTEGEAAAKSRDHALQTLETLTGWYRDLLIWRETKESRLLFRPDQTPVIDREADNYDTGTLIDIISDIEKAGKGISGNANTRLLMEGLFLKINSYSSQARSLRSC